jgi:hypothetical protein
VACGPICNEDAGEERNTTRGSRGACRCARGWVRRASVARSSVSSGTADSAGSSSSSGGGGTGAASLCVPAPPEHGLLTDGGDGFACEQGYVKVAGAKCLQPAPGAPACSDSDKEWVELPPDSGTLSCSCRDRDLVPSVPETQSGPCVPADTVAMRVRGGGSERNNNGLPGFAAVSSTLVIVPRLQAAGRGGAGGPPGHQQQQEPQQLAPSLGGQGSEEPLVGVDESDADGAVLLVARRRLSSSSASTLAVLPGLVREEEAAGGLPAVRQKGLPPAAAMRGPLAHPQHQQLRRGVEPKDEAVSPTIVRALGRRRGARHH